MRQLDQIKSAYDWMIDAINRDIAAALDNGDTAAVSRLTSSQDTLERGVYVLLFGQFENEVTATFEAARDKRKDNPDWSIRRGWDISAYGARSVKFETKLALVLDRKNDFYGSILNAYSTRNHCAHGGMTNPVGSIDDFVNDLRQWYAALKR